MKLKKKLSCFALTGMLLLCGCGGTGNDSDTAISDDTEADNSETVSVETELAKIDMTGWQYNEENDVYWQTGIVYCENPADSDYENLGIFVPGAYMTGIANGDGTYTCEVDAAAYLNGYTAESAPIVIPVETPGYSAMAAPTDYVDSTASYTDAGFIYVYAGCRGRDAGAPAGVTDLKAAIRYVRYNADLLPGNFDSVFSFGMSGGGAQSALLGATGDSELYEPYLEAIGAVSGVSDAVTGSMCWCPITNLDTADAAYEWNMGVTRSDLSDEMQQISDGLAASYADYINTLGLTDENGTVLLLSESEDGIYQAGSYYEYLKEVIETSLNNFLEDTAFPYTSGSSDSGFGGRGNGGMTDGKLPDDADFADGELPDGTDFADGEAPDGAADGELPDDADFADKEALDGAAADGDTSDDASGRQGKRGGKNGAFADDSQGTDASADSTTDGEDATASDGAADGEENEYYAQDGITRNEQSGSSTLSGTYETAQDYIDALNADYVWITYDSTTNTAEITSIADFVTACKTASKSLGAFDQLDGGQGENVLFGYGDGEGAHFDATLAELLEGTEYSDNYSSDLEKTDALGNTVDVRLNMYTPLYYLCESYDGYQTSNVATYWRIRSGINQSDTALSTEVNLALALEAYGADVDFETVWGQGHVEAERTGDSTTNFIEWVNECCN